MKVKKKNPFKINNNNHNNRNNNKKINKQPMF
jgi:hypothetical protein